MEYSKVAVANTDCEADATKQETDLFPLKSKFWFEDFGKNYLTIVENILKNRSTVNYDECFLLKTYKPAAIIQLIPGQMNLLSTSTPTP